MAIYGNFKGTTQTSFKIGKSGKSIHGTSTLPVDAGQGDLWLDSSNSAIRIYDGADWDNGQFVGNLEGYMEYEAQAGENLVKGDVVYVSGNSGNIPIVSKAQANAGGTKMPAFGICTQTINTGNTGYIVTQGLFVGINTSTFTPGDTLYVSATTAGAMANVSPSGEENKIQNIGKVVRSASGGSILVGGAGRFNATNALNQGNIFLGDASNRAVTANLDTTISGLGFIKNVVEDTTPQLGGNLDAQSYNISSAGSISGTSIGVTGQFTLPTTDGDANAYLITNGSGTLTWQNAPVNSFIYEQSAAATTWTVNHNLGVQYPIVEVSGTNGESFAGTMNYPVIDFVSENQLTATFSANTAGNISVVSGGGSRGYTGSQGVIGYTGSQGVIGYTGSQGVIGYTGSSGSVATLQQVTDNGSTTTNSITTGGIQTTVITSGSNATAGTITGDWTLTAGSTWQATYADLAEKYTVDMPYEAGTVMKFGGPAEITQSTQADDTRVAGVISDAPAYIMNSGIEGQYLALAGRVPVKVVGSVVPGDLLVSSNTPGCAVVNNQPDSGTVIGKAITTDANGVCEALVILM